MTRRKKKKGIKRANPWGAKDVKRFNKSCAKKKPCRTKWPRIANAILREDGDEGKAIRIANYQAKRMGLYRGNPEMRLQIDSADLKELSADVEKLNKAISKFYVKRYEIAEQYAEAMEALKNNLKKIVKTIKQADTLRYRADEILSTAKGIVDDHRSMLYALADEKTQLDPIEQGQLVEEVALSEEHVDGIATEDDLYHLGKDAAEAREAAKELIEDFLTIDLDEESLDLMPLVVMLREMIKNRSEIIVP